MLLYIVVLVATIISVVGYVLSSRSWETFYLDEFLAILSFVFGAFLLLLTVIAVSTQITQGVKSQKLQNERNIVQVQINRINESNDGEFVLKGDFGSLEDAYGAARTVNNKIITSRHWRDNLWVNWFFNSKNGDVEPITFE